MENTSEASTQPNQPRQLGFEFRGDGMEYFKIWIGERNLIHNISVY